ncbi:hypothetical protein CF319_g6044 [Tilletia indica]|nr:hypothetical protein CF319_g6044 [Tilletia indica]
MASTTASAPTTDSGKKRKQPSTTLFPSSTTTTKQTTIEDDDEDDDDDNNPTSINVDFAFLTPDPEIDSQAIRRLLQQLFYTHSPTLDLHSPTATILTQAAHLGIGTVVKLDLTEDEQKAQGEDSDPYALITALPSTLLQDSLVAYVRARFGGIATAAPFAAAFEQAHTSQSLLFLLHERMVNLPAQLAPPLYRILFSELTPFLSSSPPPAVDEGTDGTPIAQAYTLLLKAKANTQVLFFTRLYSEAAFSDDEGDEDMDDVDGQQSSGNKKKNKPSFAQRRQKRRKAEQQQSAATAGDDTSLHYFHPEDEILIKYASHTHTFRFPAPPSAVSSFEAPIFGRIFLLPLTALFDLSQSTKQATPTADSITLGPALVELEKVLAESASASV